MTKKKMTKKKRNPPVTISDRNAFAIMGVCRLAAHHAGWTKDEIDEMTAEMQAGDYAHLRRVVALNFEVY